MLAGKAKELGLRALIACGYNFGFRKAELVSLRVEQINFFDKRIELFGAQTKNGKPRKVPMTTDVFELLEECVS